MEALTRTKAERKNCDDDKEDDDVSVIAVIGKENDRSSKEQRQQQQQRNNEKPHQKRDARRVFELSDERAKMALRKQLDLEALSTERESKADEYEGMSILQKLPPGTIVIKQDKKYKDDSDYVRDSTETSSGGSTSGGGAPKVRRVYRATRKSRGTVEVRRNPIRVMKKDPDKDFSRPRQRLLSAKRKEMLLASEPTKRGKSSTMPYMNTRSVTRKMYNVGATYQAPTIGDATEWKEWPVHGMHERPVFHPQIGLAAEYLGRYFTSLDGLSYREIVDRPEIEVVSVDPHSDFLPSSTEKKRNRKSKSNKSSSNCKSTRTSSSQASKDKPKSFESCMHESFHCVLGYCSQVMTPTYKTNVEGKINMLGDTKTPPNPPKEVQAHPPVASIVDQSFKSEPSVSFKENVQKPLEEGGYTVLDNYTVAMYPQGVKNFTPVPKTRLFPAQKVYVANSQKSIAFTNLKTFQGGQLKVQDMVRSSKSPFILVNPAANVNETPQHSKPVASNNVNVMKLEESSSTEETLGELSSIYTNALNEELTLKPVPPKNRAGNKVEYTVTKYLVDNVQQSKFQMGKEANSTEKKLCYDAPGTEMNAKSISTSVTGVGKTWCPNETSEIAKILSEYNKSTQKKPAIENALCSNMKNIRMKQLCKEESVKQRTQENSTDRNMNITFPQGKWRRFHLTVEKLKDIKNSPNEKRLPSGVAQSRQPFYKVEQIAGETSSDNRMEGSKQLEVVQRGQSSVTSLEKKENTSTLSCNVDTITMKTQSLQELLENTAMLYCAATGTHQDDLATYVDSLDAVQSIQWLEARNHFA